MVTFVLGLEVDAPETEAGIRIVLAVEAFEVELEGRAVGLSPRLRAK
jgi:hypothetical protein